MNHSVRQLSALSLSLLLASGCGATAPQGASEEVGAEESELRTEYGDLFSTLADADLERWIHVRRALLAGFARVCGDGLCSGDYSNLTTVRLACSSTTKARKLKDCVWVLGASVDYVEGQTAEILGEARAFTCKIPVGGTAKTLLDTLTAAGDDALNAALPATGKSFYDGLVDCFANVSGPTLPTVSQPKYVELTDYFWSKGADAAASWAATQQRLNKNFDDLCGDSFCEGVYPDISGLRFACAVNASTERVERCMWSFAGADSYVEGKGAIAVDTMTRRCSVDVGATVTQLTTALSKEDALRAKLPGKSTSIYDALIGCL